jgi:type I restriction enzyme S subunit
MYKGVLLKDLIEKPISGEWGKEGDDVFVLRTTNFTNEGKLNLNNVVKRNIDISKIQKKKLFKGDIIIEKSGGSPKQPVGRVVFFDIEGDYLCNNFTSILRPKKEVFPKYLLYVLFSFYNKGVTNKYQNKTTGIINLKLQNYISDVKIPLPPLPVQKKIAAILDEADKLRQLNAALIKKYDALNQSLFLDMFGDPVTNPKGWDIEEFGKHISILTDYHANGSYKLLAKHVKLKDEKDYALMIRTTDLENENFNNGVKYIDENAYNFLEKTKVFGGEIIINKIGSAGNVYLMPKLHKPVSLGMNAFMLRFKESVNTKFIYFQLTGSHGKREINKRVKGAVTKTIRKDAVREIPIIIPPIDLQNQFAERVQLIEQQKQQAQEALQKSEELFNSLLQKAFKGELV